MNTIIDHIRAAGREGGWALALIVALAAVAFVYLKLPAEVGAPLPETVHVVPASGPSGFPVETFCEDDATAVRVTFIPDGGPGYELVRVKDGVTELVQWNSNEHTNRTAAYYSGTSLTDGEPAYMTDGAIECVQDKAR